MSIYCIRHKQTRALLSQYFRGASYWNGEDDGKFAPRIFSLRGAKSFVSQWALGEHRNTVLESNDPIIGYDCEYVHEVKDVGRKRGDLEIVPVTLIVGEPI